MKNFFLAALQYLLLFYLFFSGPIYIFNVPFVLIQGVSILLIFWALLIRQLYKSRASRRVPKGVYLITKGPYEIIRHPIYAGFLLFVLSYSPGYYMISQYLAFLLLLVLFLSRINHDDKLTERFFKNEYLAYKKKTKSLIPYIY